MPVVERLQFGDVDLSNLKKSQVRAAFVLKVPFRFRVGTFLRFPLAWTDGDYEICVHNSVDIPTGQRWKDIKPALDDHCEVWSDVLIIVKEPSPKQETVQAISRGEEIAPISFLGIETYRALTVLNQLIIASERARHKPRIPHIKQGGTEQ